MPDPFIDAPVPPEPGSGWDSIKKKWDALPGNVRGGIWALIATVFFSGMIVLIKIVGQRLHVTEVLFFRQAAMVAISSPLIIAGFPGSLKSARVDLQMVRLACAFVAMTCGFSAVIHLPLAEASTLSFAKNFFVTVLAIFFLGEVVGLRRWGAVTVGFIGVLIVLWPTGEGAFSIYGVLALISAAAVAVVFILIRKLAQVDKPLTIMSYQAIGIGVLMIPPTIWFWQTPTWPELLMLAGIGVLSVIGQYCNIFALRVGEASALAPIDYTRLLMVLALGWWVFSEWPEDRVFVGAGIIIAAALYTLYRERKVGAVKSVGS